MEAILILNDIRSAQNVGSLFRTSDAVGISKIFLSLTTPAPIDRFGRERSDIAKTALGAQKNISWEQYDDIFVLLEKLKQEGFTIIAIEQDEASIDYKEIIPTDKMAFILGNEVTGLPKEVVAKADIVAEIPMAGEKESLNVSVAGGVALFRILNK